MYCPSECSERFFYRFGAYILAVWQNKSEARNKMILELNTIEERANTVLNYTYATNENLNVELFPMQIELTHPMFDSVEKMKRIYPLLNQKILRLIERLNVQVQQFEMTLNGVVLDHHNNLYLLHITTMIQNLMC